MVRGPCSFKACGCASGWDPGSKEEGDKKLHHPLPGATLKDLRTLYQASLPEADIPLLGRGLSSSMGFEGHSRHRLVQKHFFGGSCSHPHSIQLCPV